MAFVLNSNTPSSMRFKPCAIQLYQKLGYREFARISNFTYWDGKMWQDIRMEKYL